MALLLLFAILQPPPPVAGRPADYSGAVGGPFLVTARLSSPSVTVESPVTLTVSVVGPGDLSQMNRPGLQPLTDDFVIEAGPERTLTAPPGREFDYVLRPRAAGTKSLTKIKLVYFNPAIKPAARGYQTTYAEPVELNVIPRPLFKIESKGRLDVEYEHRLRPTSPVEWWNNQFEGWGWGRPLPEGGSGQLPGWLWLVPPLGCAAVLAVRRRRSGQVSDVRAALYRLNEDRADHGRQVADVVRRFLAGRSLISSASATAEEVEADLRRFDEGRAAMVASLMRRCDAESFGRRTDTGDLAADARALLREWDSWR